MSNVYSAISNTEHLVRQVPDSPLEMRELKPRGVSPVSESGDLNLGLTSKPELSRFPPLS